MPSFKDSLASTPAGPSSAPTPTKAPTSAPTHEILKGASEILHAQGLDLCPHCFRETRHCSETFELA